MSFSNKIVNKLRQDKYKYSSTETFVRERLLREPEIGPRQPRPRDCAARTPFAGDTQAGVTASWRAGV